MSKIPGRETWDVFVKLRKLHVGWILGFAGLEEKKVSKDSVNLC